MEKATNYPGCPFHTSLDLSGLINYWKANLSSEGFSHFSAKEVLDRISNASELHRPIEDPAVLDKYSDLIGLLMSVIFPPALTDNILMGAHVPFNFDGFYATPGYREILPFDAPRDDIRLYTDIGDAETGTLMMTFLFILNKHFGANVDYQLPILLGVPDNKDGLERIYKLEVDTRFVDVSVRKTPPELDQEIISLLIENLYDLELWQKYINPEDFMITGFALHKLVDVTDQETLSSIKFYLLSRDAVTCGTNFTTIQDKMRTLFRLPDLRLGLVFFDSSNNIITSAGISDWNTFMIKDRSQEHSCNYFQDSIYDLSFTDQKPVVIEDLEKYDRQTKIEKTLIEQG
ncbi:MAG: hypothetical protein P8X57_15590, partial [Cyclobacteriaceae bacterium]